MEENIVKLSKEARPLTLKDIHVKVKELSADGKVQEALQTLQNLTESLYATAPDVETLRIQAELNDQLGQYLWAEYARANLAVISNDKSFDREKILFSTQQAAIDDPQNADCLFHLAEVFLKTQHHVAAMVALSLAAEYSQTEVYESPIFIAATSRWSNLGSICELMAEKYPVALTISKNDESCGIVLAELLTVSGREVHFLQPPLSEESDNPDVDAITAITIQNIQHQNNLHIYQPIALVKKGTVLCDNSANVLKHICAKVGFVQIFCEKELMDSYLKDKQRLGQRFTPNINTGVKALAGGYIGPYTTYIKHIHRSEIYSMPIFGKAEVGISVVIPTRDSAHVLEHNLKTCLNQRVDNYEILVCDNSTPGNNETKELVERLNSPKIRYIRAPRDLPMTKNFEHAILNAKGEFIFTLGSDEGLLQHSLEIMSRVIKDLPNDDVIQWNVCFYIWPDYKQEGRQGLLTIPGLEFTTNYVISRHKSSEMMELIFQNPALVLNTPMLYVNSGFRKRYIHKLIEKTGRILDGTSPDVYVGLVNMALNDTIPMVSMPLVLRGQSSASNGAKFINGNKDATKIGKDHFSPNIGQYIPNSVEELIAITPSIVTTFVDAYLRTVSLNISQDLGTEQMFDINKIDWEKFYNASAAVVQLSNLKFDLYMRQLTYAAYRHGKKFGKWFERDILPKAYLPREEVKIPTEKTFKRGFKERGSLTLDTELFGVTNIYEASELFDKLYNL